MSVFTDDDLKRFKEWAIDCLESDKFYCRTHEIASLLARLEAAEAVCETYQHFTTSVYHRYCGSLEAMDKWLKASGKSSPKEEEA